MRYTVEFTFMDENEDTVGRKDLFIETTSYDDIEIRLIELLASGGMEFEEGENPVELRGLVSAEDGESILYMDDIVYSMEEVKKLVTVPCRKLSHFTQMLVRRDSEGTRDYSVCLWKFWSYPERLPQVIKDTERLAKAWNSIPVKRYALVGWAIYKDGEQVKAVKC